MNRLPIQQMRWRTRRLRLMPAERADVIVDFSMVCLCFDISTAVFSFNFQLDFLVYIAYSFEQTEINLPNMHPSFGLYYIICLPPSEFASTPLSHFF